MNKQMVEYQVTDAAIAKMQNDFMSLTISGLDDKQGFAKVHAARMIVKNTRLDVEKIRKALKADALAWGQKVDAEARRITKLLEPIENHLTFEEEKITKEKARVEAEKKRLAEERAQSIVNEFAKYGYIMPYADAMAMSDADYSVRIESIKQAWHAEQDRLANEKRKEEERRQAEEAKAKAEAERLMQERIELERIRAEEDAKRKLEESIRKAEREKEAAQLAAERAEAERKRIEQEAILAAEREKIAAERRAIEAERLRQEHAAAMERAKKEAAEKAEREAIERAERETKEKEERERKAKAEVERQERLKPDKEKMMALADKIESMPLPEVVSPSAQIVMDGIKERVESLCEFIRKSVERI